MIARFFRLLIKIYSYIISPFLGQNCRYYPTCSCYADQAIGRHGVVKGGFLAVMRISRCHPWSKHPYIDPVPQEFLWKRQKETMCISERTTECHLKDI